MKPRLYGVEVGCQRLADPACQTCYAFGMTHADRIATPRLTLAPPTLRDAGFLWALHGNAQVRKYLGGPVPWRRRRDRVRQLCRALPGYTAWVVHGAPGRIGLIEVSRHKDGVDWEVSYQFNPRAWGHGFASEAVGGSLTQVHEALGVARIIAETQGANSASCQLLLRLGFREEQRVTRFGAEQVIFVKEFE